MKRGRTSAVRLAGAVAVAILVLCAALLIASCGDSGSKSADVDWSTVDWSSADSLIEQTMGEIYCPGLAAAVVADGQTVWTGAYGWADTAKGVPVTADTPFVVASVSKTVTATALMQLVERGLVSLDDPINDLLPFDVDNPKVGGEVIRVRHLVSHSSGIADDWSRSTGSGTPDDPALFNSRDYDYPTPLDEWMHAYLVEGGKWYSAEGNFLELQPGVERHYCNVAAGLVGLIVEEATQTPFDDYCEAELFGPLEMTHTHWRLADYDDLDQVANGYGLYGQNYGHIQAAAYPAGGLMTSANDLARFLAAVMGGGILDGRRILDESTVRELLSPPEPDVVFPEPGPPIVPWYVGYPNTVEEQYVLWYREEVNGRHMVGHKGGSAGTNVAMFFEPASNTGVVILMNVTESTHTELARREIQTHLLNLVEEQKETR